MDFEEVIRFEQLRGTVPEDWRQGRTAFGGVLAAAGVRALKSRVDPGRKLRYFSAQYVAPVGEGEVEIRLSELATGGSVSNAVAAFYSEERLCMQMTAVFAKPRYSSKPVIPESVRLQNPEGLPSLPYIEGVVPQFTRNLEFRWLEGGFPFSGHQEAVISGFCRHKTAAGEAVEATIGLLDAWPAPVLPLLDRPSPASTISWSAHFYDPPVHRPTDWWFYRALPVSFEEGYATTEARLYAPDGRLVAWSEQLVAVYERARA